MTGNVVALGRLEDDRNSTAAAAPSPGNVGSLLGWATNCWYVFTIPAVPDAPFYSIAVGRREGPTYSRAELEASGGAVELELRQ